MNEELYGLLGLDPEKIRQQQMQSGLLSAGLQLLAGSGYSPVRRSTGELLGQAGAAGLGAYQQAGQTAIDEVLRGMQVQKMRSDLEASRRQQAALQSIRASMAPPAQAALAEGGGPTIANADRMAGLTSSGLSREQLLQFAANPDLPAEERNIFIKLAEQLKTPEISLPAGAALYAQRMGYGTDPRKFTASQAQDVQQFIERPTIDQQVSMARLGYETGITLPGTRQPTTGQAPSQQAAAQPTTTEQARQPSISASGLSPKAQQEIKAKIIEARPAVLNSASYSLTQIKDTRDTAQKLLNDPEAIKAISGLTGPVSTLVPGTKAFDARAMIENLQARNFVSEIQTMRQNNPTGGAVGNVAIQEMQSLSNIPAVLKVGQSEDQLRSQLEQLVRRSDAAMTSIVDSYKRDYGATDGLEQIKSRSVVETAAPVDIPSAAVDMLKRNPKLADKFDEKYGAGAAKRVLGR